MARVLTRVVGSPEEVAPWLAPRDDLVGEQVAPEGGPTTFSAIHGPFREYRRAVTVDHLGDGTVEVISTTRFRLAIPYFSWLFVLPVRRVLARPDRGHRQPWWAPPDRLDARAAHVLGVLALASVIAGYLGTLLTQTITFAAEEFGLEGSRPQGYTLAAVRVGVLVAMVLVAVADRRGRRPVLVACALGG
ncbi:MAG: hypothetical protein M3507_02310, partial [Actinomycetota bacterium]|nr:hypothetical protein [Actinomycetota bacterium]